MNFHEPVRVLLVEDNPGDVRLMREALKESHQRLELSVVNDGEAALLFLRREGAYSRAPRPNIVFLDLNLPRRDGREVLAEIKRDMGLRAIPVIILTTSTSDRDVQNAYELQANCYITKPVELSEFFDVVKRCEVFWMETVQLPR